MTDRQAHLRSRAAADIEDAIAFLRSNAGDAVALAFIDALETGISNLKRSPNAGSPRFAFDLGIPELRGWRVRRFPYVIFYVVLTDRNDIWRVLHTRRDIPGSFTAAD